jgi:putative YjhG/YagF family dehydratase
MNANDASSVTVADVLDSDDAEIFQVLTTARGPEGRLPLTEKQVLESPSGHIFAYSQNAGMGWSPEQLGRDEYLILSTLGGMRAPDGRPVALGYHTGHWEVGILVEAAARELKRIGCIPYSVYCSDPCDGRSQGTTGMFDSLPYRNDAATVLRRLVRSLPTRKGVMGIGTCDKGLPAILLALAGTRDLPVIVVPGGVTLPPQVGEDAGKIQSVGMRLAHGEITLDEITDLGCRACATPGGGCQFLGTAATSQVVTEALGLALPHGALAPSGQPVWRDLAIRSARALVAMEREGITSADVVTESALRNAMVVHAAFGGSTNLVLHIPAIAFAAGRPRPTVQEWDEVNRQVPRLVEVMPNGPHTTVRAYLAGAVPEVMLHLRDLELLDLDALTVSGKSVGDNLAWWQGSERRSRFRDLLREIDGVEPEEVILSPDQAREKGITSTICFPLGNIAPEGSIVKSTGIDPSVVDEDGVFRHRGKAKVFVRERHAIAALKNHQIEAGDVMVLLSCGPMGTGMEEIAQVTLALKYVEFGKQVAVLTDARFSGISTGACIGHIGPEALAGGPLGKLVDGDLIEIIIDRNSLEGHVDFVGTEAQPLDRVAAAAELSRRPPRPDLAAEEQLPDDTRLWAELQRVGGGTWGGCVYDVDQIIETLRAGQEALGVTQK